MEEQLIRCLKNLVSELASDEPNVETMVNNFLTKSELTISPAAQEELTRHIYYTFNAVELPE